MWDTHATMSLRESWMAQRPQGPARWGEERDSGLSQVSPSFWPRSLPHRMEASPARCLTGLWHWEDICDEAWAQV